MTKGGEFMANDGRILGTFKLSNDYHTLDVVSNGMGQFLCVRANDEADITHTQYWMAIAQGKPGRDGKDGIDGKSPSIEISEDGTWVINGRKTTHNARGPAGSMGITSDLTASQDLNSLKTNGFYYGDKVATTNSPFDDSSKVGFTLQVIASTSGSAVQQVVDVATADSWVRSYDGSKWTDWRGITQWN